MKLNPAKLTVALVLLVAIFVTLGGVSYSQSCAGTSCECTLSSSQFSTGSYPCTSTISYSITGVTNGCCSSGSCTGTTPSSCDYTINFTLLSVNCCWYIHKDGTSMSIPGGCGPGGVSPSFSPNPITCGRDDVWEVFVDSNSGSGCNCTAIPANPQVRITVVCNKGTGC